MGINYLDEMSLYSSILKFQMLEAEEEFRLSGLMPEYCCYDGSEQKKQTKNCPNCGAPVNGPICEYCGTSFSGKKHTPQSAPNKTLEVLKEELERDLLAKSQEIQTSCQMYRSAQMQKENRGSWISRFRRKIT